MRDQDTEVLVVGAGPVGLLLAILLGRAGRQVTLIEKWPEIYDRPRAVTMDHEVARILAALGIDCDSDPDFENHKELYYWKNADLQTLQIVDWESLAPSGWHVTYWFNQPDLERRLMALVLALPLPFRQTTSALSFCSASGRLVVVHTQLKSTIGLSNPCTTCRVFVPFVSALSTPKDSQLS